MPLKSTSFGFRLLIRSVRLTRSLWVSLRLVREAFWNWRVADQSYSATFSWKTERVRSALAWFFEIYHKSSYLVKKIKETSTTKPDPVMQNVRKVKNVIFIFHLLDNLQMMWSLTFEVLLLPDFIRALTLYHSSLWMFGARLRRINDEEYPLIWHWLLFLSWFHSLVFEKI